MRWHCVGVFVLLGCGAAESSPGGSAATGGAAPAGAAGSSSGGSAAAAAGGGAGIGSAGGGGGAGGAGSSAGGASGACVEIRLGPPGLVVGLNEWAQPDDGVIKTIGAEFGAVGATVHVRNLATDGASVVDVAADIPQSWYLPITCAWRGARYLCVSEEQLTSGSTDTGGAPMQLPPLPADVAGAAAHWDGEAFSLHVTSNKFGKGTLELVRLDLTGAIIQGRTHVAGGVSQSQTPERPRIVTDPKSGRTFVIGGSSLQVLQASAHERDGTPLFEMGKIFPTTPNLSSKYPGVGVYEGGVLVATRGDMTASAQWPKPNFYHLSASGTLTLLPKVPLPDGETTDSGIQIAVVAHGPNDGWVVASTVAMDGTTRLVLIDWKQGAFGPLQVIMDSRDSGTKGYYLVQQNHIAFEVAGQRWVGVHDLTVPTKPTVRLMRVDDPSCRYAPIAP